MGGNKKKRIKIIFLFLNICSVNWPLSRVTQDRMCPWMKMEEVYTSHSCGNPLRERALAYANTRNK